MPSAGFRYTYEVAPVFTLMEQVVLGEMCRIVGFENGDGVFCPGEAMTLRLLCVHKVTKNVFCLLFISITTHPIESNIFCMRSTSVCTVAGNSSRILRDRHSSTFIAQAMYFRSHFFRFVNTRHAFTRGREST